MANARRAKAKARGSTEKGHIKSNCPQKVIDDKKSDSKSSSATDKVMLVTSLGSGNWAPGEIVELMVDSGATAPTCPPRFGADAPVSQELSLRKLVGASRHALRYYSVRELDFSVAARQVQVKWQQTSCQADRAGIQC